MISPELDRLRAMLDELRAAELEVQAVEDGGLCLVDSDGDVWAYTGEESDYFAAVEELLWQFRTLYRIGRTGLECWVTMADDEPSQPEKIELLDGKEVLLRLDRPATVRAGLEAVLDALAARAAAGWSEIASPVAE